MDLEFRSFVVALRDAHSIVARVVAGVVAWPRDGDRPRDDERLDRMPTERAVGPQKIVVVVHRSTLSLGALASSEEIAAVALLAAAAVVVVVLLRWLS